jgi:hypothetical protein
VRDKASKAHEVLGNDEMPKPGTVVAIDAEFVQMQQVCLFTYYGIELTSFF